MSVDTSWEHNSMRGAMLAWANRRLRLRSMAPDDGNIGAGLCKPARHAKANAAIAAGDNGHLASEVEQWVCHRWYPDVAKMKAGSLSRWERVGVRGYDLSIGCDPSPGSQGRSDLSPRER